MENISLKIKRVINAPIDRVFKAWIDSEELKQWHHPEGMTTPNATSDLVVGGNYSITMHSETVNDTAFGVYQEIDAPHKLVFSWGWEGQMDPITLVTVLLKELGESQTELTLLHEHFPTEEMMQGHNTGWEDALNNLEVFAPGH